MTSSRMTIVTIAAGIAVAALAGCGGSTTVYHDPYYSDYDMRSDIYDHYYQGNSSSGVNRPDRPRPPHVTTLPAHIYRPPAGGGHRGGGGGGRRR